MSVFLANCIALAFQNLEVKTFFGVSSILGQLFVSRQNNDVVNKNSLFKLQIFNVSFLKLLTRLWNFNNDPITVSRADLDADTKTVESWGGGGAVDLRIRIWPPWIEPPAPEFETSRKYLTDYSIHSSWWVGLYRFVLS